MGSLVDMVTTPRAQESEDQGRYATEGSLRPFRLNIFFRKKNQQLKTRRVPTEVGNQADHLSRDT